MSEEDTTQAQESAEQAELNEQQLKELAQYLAASGSTPQQEEKYNTHLFLHRVATSDDTTKTGNLTDLELGMPRQHLRAMKQMALISDKIMDNSLFKDYFNAKSEIITATSLSKEGFLVKQATTTTRQIADVTKKKATANKSWFTKKEKPAEGEQTQ